MQVCFVVFRILVNAWAELEELEVADSVHEYVVRVQSEMRTLVLFVVYAETEE